MTRPLVPLLVVLTLVLAPSAGAATAEMAGKRTVHVTGIGIVTARPDIAEISMGVVSEGASAREALDKNTAAMSRVIVELKSQDVEEKDIKTTNFAVHPKFQHFQDGKPPAIVGYRVVNSVSVTVRNLKKLGAVLDQSVSSGSNQINGIEFSVSDTGQLKNQARKQAMANARSKAELYAGAGNAKLGKVLVIDEESISSPPTPVLRRATLDAKAAPAPVEPGEHQVQTRVKVTWELTE